ncbi:integrase [Pseudolabrys taiwanensis]|uniref:Integrase n=1 Tax=Pseudolabrys taiwanensis TaxID=331696 RepID=A0A345ZRV2_9HYPH|nr:tyrosine-type recombinase/integrase [Pseudolabrys taiwanensis]AXK79649.1 integrase [Pseudolabrys taiwanensis]
MPRPRPPHLQLQTTRHGKRVWYVRIGKGPRTRIRAEFGTPEFDTEYQAAITGNPRPQKDTPSAHSLAWLITRYRETTPWFALSMATRRQRENIFENVLKTAGSQPFAKITKATIVAGRERRASTPAQSRNFLDAMRGLFRWAQEAGHVKVDPTDGVGNPPRKKGDGFVPWTEEHVALFQKRWPLGTRQRVWLDVLLYSGLRRGDAVRYGRQHVRNGVGRIPTEKSGLQVTAVVPVLPILAKTLEAGPTGEVTFICGANGKPLTKESFGNLFREACDEAGVPGSAHGVRKIAATTAANNGATVSQLKALFGWTSDSMAALYTKSADRDRLAREAGHLLANAERTSIPSPKSQVRAGAKKAP